MGGLVSSQKKKGTSSASSSSNSLEQKAPAADSGSSTDESRRSSSASNKSGRQRGSRNQSLDGATVQGVRKKSVITHQSPVMQSHKLDALGEENFVEEDEDEA
eukprot:TRINITY_DN6862_c0_g2_i3.p2 TRINITY_DN6862_c0_g2~~TRINITY_DN6862_c0_g2_i3.p2  ORF type:complete len:103 (-),score=29.52 TRINITY_DN6862_c0_g2_i3:1005-1313(-)